MSEKNIKKIGIRDALGEYIYTDIGVDADKVDIDSSTNLAEKLVEIDNKFEDLKAGDYANKDIYGDEKINLGRKTGTAAGPYSVTIGRDVSATGTCSLAEGKDTAANGNYSHAEGMGTTASGFISHAEGYNTKASEYVSHSEGYITTASGNSAHSEGYNTTASGNSAHSEGYNTTASGNSAHSEGYNTTASGNSAHSEGTGTKANGDYAHSEGYYTTANGDYAHSEGYYTTASGDSAHSEGDGTIASGQTQHVQGRYNVEDTEGRYAHIVGGGTKMERKNIHTIDWNGNADFAGEVKCSNVLKTLTECEASTKDTDIAGASALAELKDDFKSIILNSAYPVGTVYMSTKNTSPATFLGGTWSAISADKYFKTITSGTGGSTGGSTTSGSTTLTVNQIPSHSHSDLMYGTGGGKIGLEYSGASGSNQYSLKVGSGTSIATQTAGGGQGHTHTINPPYYTVYAWVRTA